MCVASQGSLESQSFHACKPSKNPVGRESAYGQLHLWQGFCHQWGSQLAQRGQVLDTVQWLVLLWQKSQQDSKPPHVDVEILHTYNHGPSSVVHLRCWSGRKVQSLQCIVVEQDNQPLPKCAQQPCKGLGHHEPVIPIAVYAWFAWFVTRPNAPHQPMWWQDRRVVSELPMSETCRVQWQFHLLVSLHCHPAKGCNVSQWSKEGKSHCIPWCQCIAGA